MIKVLVFGTFDGLHKGHKDFFRQARHYGDYLVVVIGRDSTVGRVKKRLPQFTELDRQKAVQECGLVDQVVLGNEGSDPYKIIEQIQPDVICLGYDQTHFTDKLTEELPKRGLAHVKIHRLEAFEPEKYHSSILHKI
jgi:FAD synthetase